MKKILLVLLIISIVSASAFAGGWIGIDGGPGMSWMKAEGTDFAEISLNAGLSGAHYFTDSIGVGYGAGLRLPVKLKIENSSYSKVPDKELDVYANLSFQYKHDFTDSLALEAGAGAYIMADNQKYLGEDKVWIAGFLGNIGVRLLPAKHISLGIGARFLVPVVTMHDKSDIKIQGVDVQPYMSLAFSY